MQVKETIVAGVAATSIMTGFSYAVSALAHENFKEPRLLSLFIKRFTAVRHPLLHFSGWPVHYALGLVWAGVYTLCIRRNQKEASAEKALAFGLFSGATGVMIWRVMFRKHPHPPQTAHGKFYSQLFLAHILFALSLEKTLSVLKQH